MKRLPLGYACLFVLALAAPALADPPLPIIPTNQYNILDFGAYGDGISNNAAAIQGTIDAAVAAGGGTVLVPAGGTLSTYLSGPISLGNAVNLQIGGGAMLQMLPKSSWPGTTTFINGNRRHDVEISGTGTIDGNANFGTGTWWGPFPGNSPASSRPNFINLSNCTNSLIHNVTLQNPPTFHLMLKNNNVNLTIEDILINTSGDSPNTDGMDLGSTNVLIRNCVINAGDDNIEIGGSSAAAVDITISNCAFGTGHGVSLGSLVNGAGGGVRNLLVSNCTFNGTDYGIRMKSDRDRGGVCQNLRYLDITMTNVGYAIVIYSYYNSVGTPNNISAFRASTDTVHTITSTTPIWRNITIDNVTASGLTGSRIAGIIWGVPEMLVSNVTLSRVNIAAPNKTFSIYNARGIQILDSNLTAPSTTNTLVLYNAEIIVTNSAANTNLVTLGGLEVPPTNNLLSFFNAQAAITDTNMVRGGVPITLGGSTLRFTQDSVSFSNNLSVLAASTLAVTSGSNTFAGLLVGTGPLTFSPLGSSRLTLLSDSSSFGGDVTVSNGTLLINNTTGSGTGTGAVTVLSGATLGGTGIIGGPVTVDGALAPGNSPGTLTISNNLVVNAGAALQYELGTNSDLTVVGGNLTLDGTINIADAGGFITNTYTLLTYAGALAGNGLTVGVIPDASLLYRIDTNTAGLVKLVVAIPPPVAGFIPSATAGIAPLTVTFTDTSTGPISHRHWDFGDGATSNILATSVAHTYTAGGSNTVQLIVSGPGGVSTNSTLIIVAPPCNFPLSATNASFGVTGGSNTVTVTPYTNVCAWTASSNDSWIQIAGGGVSTSGVGTVAYTVLSNASSSSPRIGTLTIAGQTFTVTQAGDTTPPTVALTAPASGVVSNTIVVSAIALDDVAVVKIEFYRDSGILLGSVSTPPYNLNFNTATVSDGLRCLYAKAYDAANNTRSSSTNCVTVDNHAPAVPTGLTATSISSNQINVSWSASNDSGSGLAGYKLFRDGTQIATTTGTGYSDNGLATATEHCYKVAAYDNVGRVSAQSTEACAQTFAPLESLVGAYNGLVIRTNAPSHASSGSIAFTVSQTGSFAAKLALGGARASFKGQFDASGNATNTVTRKGLNPLQVRLHLDLAGSDQISGTVSDGAFTSELLADRAAYSSANPCPFAGTFTVVLEPPDGDDSSIPQGFGYGTVTVTAPGRGRVKGVLADGTKITATAPLSKHGTWPLYKALYKNKGASLGWVTFDTNSTLGATVDWFKPTLPASPFYPAGFTSDTTLIGKEYAGPSISGTNSAANRQVTLGGGNLGINIVKNVFVYDVGNVVVLSPNSENLQMKIQPATGQFSGSFTHPVLNKTINFTGSVLQFDETGAGYFLGSSESGFVIVEPIHP